MNIQWPDVGARNAPRSTFINAVKAIEAMGLRCWIDECNTLHVKGSGFDAAENANDTDALVRRLRLETRLRLGVDFGERHTEDALLLACEQGTQPEPWE